MAKPAPGTASNDGSLFSSVGTATLPTNFDVFDQEPSGAANAQAADPETEKLFDEVLTKVSDAFAPQAALIDGFQEKLETALVESGFFSDLEEKKDAFLAAISADGLTIEKIFQAAGDLVIGLIESAISAVMAILEFILDDLKEIATVIKEQLLGPGTDPILEAVFEQFGIDKFLGDYRPGLLSLPVFLISAPFTLLSLAVTGAKPEFPTISQDANEDTENKINGVLQLSKILTPFIGLLSYKLSRENKKGLAIGVGGFGDLYAIGIDVVGQVYGEPDSSKPFHKAYWISQWVTSVGIGLLIVGVKTMVDLKDEKTDSTLAHRVKPTFPGFQLFIELINFGYSIVLFASDEAEEDPRLKACYWLDSLPGALDGVISIAMRVPMNKKLERMTDDDDELLKKITDTLDTIVQKDYAWEEASFNAFYGVLPAGASDLKTIKDSLNSLEACANRILDLFNNTFLKQLKPDNATEPTNQALWDKEMAIVNLLTQINEKVSRCKSFIEAHDSESGKIGKLLQDISKWATAIQTEIKNKTPDLKNLATNGQFINQVTDPAFAEIESLGNKLLAFPSSILENRLLGLLFVENDPDTAIANDCDNADKDLDALILDDDFIELTTTEERALLTSTDYMVTLDVERTTLFRLIEKTNQLALFPTHKPFRYQQRFFPLLQNQQVNLFDLEYRLLIAKGHLETWSEKNAQAEIKKISKDIYKLESAFIVLNTIIQCVHGGLSLDAGINPIPES
ncbi:MAG: hypothetical protein H6569_15775 [Lewinellaceae bacterium]|nr:hypothetical protein [Lewinellaceae bacterium]